ncbi:MAG: porin family protein [Gammaproteobacteria bacterium]|nr:porin family protein [Gammaproteobacteria bacterium]
MKNTMLLILAGLACALTPAAAYSDAPSFNYLQTAVQHTSTSNGDNWGWGVQGSFNPVGGLFFSGEYSRTNYLDYAQSDVKTYRVNAGYYTTLADTLALYGTAGWAATEVSGSRSDGAVVGAGLRANLVSILELRVGASHYFFDDGFNEYSAGVLLHILPFMYISAGIAKYSGAGTSPDTTRWQAGLRFSF